MADVRRLPIPITTIWDWQMRAACRDVDGAVFFHPEKERGPAKAERETRAKMICVGCPVIEQCRDHALRVQEPYGVWGGLTVSERAAILQSSAPSRARPERAPAAPSRRTVTTPSLPATGVREP